MDRKCQTAHLWDLELRFHFFSSTISLRRSRNLDLYQPSVLHLQKTKIKATLLHLLFWYILHRPTSVFGSVKHIFIMSSLHMLVKFRRINCRTKNIWHPNTVNISYNIIFHRSENPTAKEEPKHRTIAMLKTLTEIQFN